MTPALYFLHLKTLDIILIIVNISVSYDAFYKKNVFYCCNLKNKLNMNVNFELLFVVVVKMTERRKNQREEWTSLRYLFTLTINKYWFCISVT